MRAHEFLREDTAATSSASIATVAQPMLTQSRQGGSAQSGKYFNDPKRKEDHETRTTHAVRQFKNSIGH